jgi:hypothetical protein
MKVVKINTRYGKVVSAREGTLDVDQFKDESNLLSQVSIGGQCNSSIGESIKEVTLPITEFTLTGTYNYTINRALIGVSIITDVRAGEVMNITNALTNYELTSDNIIINTDMELPSNFYITINGKL